MPTGTLTGFFRGRFGRSLRLHSGGAIASQILMVVISPVLVRLYRPEDLGLYGLVIGGAALAAVFFTLRLEQEIMLSDDNVDANRIASALFRLAIATGIAATIVLALIALAAGYGNAISWLAIAMGLAVMIAIQKVLWVLNFRQHRFAEVSRSRLTQAATSCCVWVAMGLAGFSQSGLLAGAAAGQAAAFLFLTPAHSPAESGGFAVLPALTRRGWRSIAFATPSELVKLLSIQLPLFAFSASFGLAQTGHLALAFRTVATPARLFGNAAGDVFYAHAAREEEPVAKLVIQTTAGLIVVAAIGFGVLYIAALPVFDVVFGPAWLDAASYARILVPYLFASFVVTPLAGVLTIARRQHLELAWQVIILAVGAAAFAFGHGLALPPEKMLAVYSLSCGLFFLVYWAMIYLSAKSRDSGN
ncbi:MAG: oligosaccharide flippase family protein [Phyllobacteriaceae bacterium]|nr:oligosaccharide flippase family protein [Phyllobacteriaceae bacterium]